jgi:hypothetical protein
VSHPIVASWAEQLARIERLVASFDGQVEVRLYANRGAVRKRPTIVLNGGPQQMEDITVPTGGNGAMVPDRS